MIKQKIVVAVTGASGSIYASLVLRLLQNELSDQVESVGIVMSDNAKTVWQHELANSDYEKLPFRFYDKNDFMAPFASGSAGWHSMIIVPCSMGTLGRIATGISDDLLTRAADVMLKERRKLVLVTRETPLNLIHLNNMTVVTQAGGIICPATPSFYSIPKDINELAFTVIYRAMELCGFQISAAYKWG